MKGLREIGVAMVVLTVIGVIAENIGNIVRFPWLIVLFIYGAVAHPAEIIEGAAFYLLLPLCLGAAFGGVIWCFFLLATWLSARNNPNVTERHGLPFLPRHRDASAKD